MNSLVGVSSSEFDDAQADEKGALDMVHGGRLQFAEAFDEPAFVYGADLREVDNGILFQAAFWSSDNDLGRVGWFLEFRGDSSNYSEGAVAVAYVVLEN